MRSVVITGASTGKILPKRMIDRIIAKRLGLMPPA
jgi:hypothetical protein